MARCLDVTAIHNRRDGSLRKTRKKYDKLYSDSLNTLMQWNLSDIYLCPAQSYFNSAGTGTLKHQTKNLSCKVHEQHWIHSICLFCLSFYSNKTGQLFQNSITKVVDQTYKLGAKLTLLCFIHHWAKFLVENQMHFGWWQNTIHYCLCDGLELGILFFLNWFAPLFHSGVSTKFLPWEWNSSGVCTKSWIYFKKQWVDVWYEEKISWKVGDIQHPLGHDGFCWNLSGNDLWWWFSWTSCWQEKHVDGDHEFVFYISKGKRLFWNWRRGKELMSLTLQAEQWLQTTSDDEVFLLRRKEGKTSVQLFVFDQLISNGKWAEEYEWRLFIHDIHLEWGEQQRIQCENGFASAKERWNLKNVRWNQDPPWDLEGKNGFRITQWAVKPPEWAAKPGSTSKPTTHHPVKPQSATKGENANLHWQVHWEYSWHMLWHHGTTSPLADMLLLPKKMKCICSLFESKWCWKEMSFILCANNKIFRSSEKVFVCFGVKICWKRAEA